MGVQFNLDIVWTSIAAFLVFFMQAGFAMVEAGFIRSKNVGNVLMKNTLDFAMGAIAFWIIGFGIMFGASESGLIGGGNFFLAKTSASVVAKNTYDSMNGDKKVLEKQGITEFKEVEVEVKGEDGNPTTVKQYVLVGAEGEVADSFTKAVSAAKEKSDNWIYVFFIFQLVFAATAATIVSGAMAGRTKFTSYLIYSFVVSFIIYPISGHWAWGSLLNGPAAAGWLENLGFMDFAGSTVVHMVGGVLGLIGAIFLGARIGKYRKDGKSNPIPGHNLPLAALGVFILWFGWYGFNPGSTTAGGPDIGFIAVTTTLGAAAGAIGALITSWLKMKAPDIGMTLNGALIGLVAITAGCNVVDPWAAVVIGLIAGVMVVFAVTFIDQKLKIDDPVGAFSVHGIGGIWGTLAIGIFGKDVGLIYGGGFKQLGIQAIGVGSVLLWVVVTGVILFFVIKKTVGLRVTKEQEIMGLDLSEHKADSYPDFRKDFMKG